MKTKLIIEFESNSSNPFDLTKGKVEVTGPLDNYMFCYGLLGMADKVVAKKQRDEENKRSNLLTKGQEVS